jgi:hypothetical protein
MQVVYPHRDNAKQFATMVECLNRIQRLHEKGRYAELRSTFRRQNLTAREVCDEGRGGRMQRFLEVGDQICAKKRARRCRAPEEST